MTQRSALAYRPQRGGRTGPLRRGGAKLSLALLGLPAAVAFVSSDPLVLAAAGAGVAVLGLASGASRALAFAARYGLALGVVMIAVNALVSQRGDTVLLRGFDLPVLGQIVVTLESLGEGATIALRVVVVVAAFAVASASVDPNELLRLLRPVARRSAMTAALIARLAPVAAADHARLREAAQLRGPAAAPVGRAALARRLVAGALDRSLDVAATLELRGYALGGRERAPGRGARSAEPALLVEGLAYRYPGAERAALDGLDLAVEPGEVVLLAGRSGSGKTTLLRAACGLVPHFHGGEIAGRVAVAGMDVREHGPGELAAAAGLVAQDPESQVVSTTVRAELALPLELRGEPAAARARAVADAASALGIAGLLERTTDSLSGGELQRVALAAALVSGPALVLLDEPLSQLDPLGADELLALLRELNERRGTAVVLAEHRLERYLEAAGRVVELERGRVAFDGEPRKYVSGAGRVAAARAARPVATPGAGSAGADGGRDPALELRGLHVELDAGDGPREVLRGIDLVLRGGERVALMGRNGAGKSTLLRACAGLVEAASGSVSAPFGCALLTQSPADFLVRERVADELPGEEGLRALRAVGLEWALDRDPRDLSGGERQRLALAIVMAGRENGRTPPGGGARLGLVCLDEPTRGMDRSRKDRLAAWMRELAAAGTAVLVATHDAELAAGCCERAVTLDAGKVVEG